MITEIIVSLIVVIGFIGIYYAVTGTPPGARIIEQEPPTSSGLDDNQANFMFFYATWCPHCKKALPEWYPFCDQYNNKKVNGYTIKCNRDGTNCTKDDDPKIASIVSQYKIESYPTIIIMREGKRYDFDAKITKSALEQFVESVTSSSK
jgi:thiol-disulfide isomerase/thioredoxin